jgi:hypothetical protein
MENLEVAPEKRTEDLLILAKLAMEAEVILRLAILI